MAVDAFGRPREGIPFVAFAGWDVAGAGWFGYPTFWVNRLGVAPDGAGRDLATWRASSAHPTKTGRPAA